MHRSVIQDTFTHGQDTRLISLIRHVVMFTLILEALGAVLLFLRFSGMYPPGRALYFSVFHAVSAFCNAGFCLYSGSFMDFSGDPLVNFTVALLIILGGIGFLVLLELKRLLLKGHRAHGARRFSLHSKLVLTLTLVLLIAGTVGFLTCEWNGSMSGLPLPTKLLAAFFQSATTRTAGFNTLDFGKIVYTLIDNELMQKNEGDSLDDFRDVFDFAQAFTPEKCLRPKLPQ